MLFKLRAELRSPSPAFVLAAIALFVALGGSSYAAVALKKDSVRSKHIKDGQVKTQDLAPGAVDSSRVADGSLLKGDFAAGQLPGDFYSRGESDSRYYTKTDSDGRFLGRGDKAADSETLDGTDSSGFVQNAGSVWHFSQTLQPGSIGGTGSVGLGEPVGSGNTRSTEFELEYECPTNLASDGTLRIRNHTGQTVDLFTDNGSSNPTYDQLASVGYQGPAHVEAAKSTGEWITFQIHEGNGHMWTIWVFSVNRVSENNCLWQYQALLTK